MRLPQDYILHIESAKDGVHITAEWQGELVRCKDCRHGEHIQIPLWENRDIDKAPSQFHDFIKCHKFHIKGFNETLYLGDDDFCSYGERREE